jgi:glutaredoxin 3
LDGQDDELEKLRLRTQYRTIPQIFIGEEFIGGYSDLKELADSGALDQKINS